MDYKNYAVGKVIKFLQTYPELHKVTHREFIRQQNFKKHPIQSIQTKSNNLQNSSNFITGITRFLEGLKIKTNPIQANAQKKFATHQISNIANTKNINENIKCQQVMR